MLIGNDQRVHSLGWVFGLPGPRRKGNQAQKHA
jgi:hypothetical protein